MIGRLNHVAIAVRDIAKASEVYRNTLGAEVSAAVPQTAHGVTTVFITLPNTKIELLHPLGDKSPIARAAELLHGEETQVHADAGYSGVEKRLEITSLKRKIDWPIAGKRSVIKALAEGAEKEARKAVEQAKAEAPAKGATPTKPAQAEEPTSGVAADVVPAGYADMTISDIKAGDTIEAFETEQVIRRLTPASGKSAGAERRV